MRLIFAGTSGFAATCLTALHEASFTIAVVITRPPRPAGRGRTAGPSPVAQVARASGLPVRAPRDINAPEEIVPLTQMAADVMVVAAYGRILGAEILRLPPAGCVNVHASLLPAWRGASPVAHALLAGEARTGVTLMQMDAGLDTGPLLAAATTPIGEGETRGELTDRLAVIGAELLVRELPGIVAGTVRPRPQDPSRASLAPPLRKADGHLDFAQAAPVVARRVQAFSPRPGAFTFVRGKRMLIRRARAVGAGTVDLGPSAAPGAVGRPGPAPGVPVRCGDGTALLLERIQMAGRSEVDALAALHGRQLAVGELLGDGASR
ncbi:MAG: methionyl-tRNA formyltransferase [Acidobacteriota bacterium]